LARHYGKPDSESEVAKGEVNEETFGVSGIDRGPYEEEVEATLPSPEGGTHGREANEMTRYFALFLITSIGAHAQQSPESPVYVEQFRNLQRSVEQIYLEVSKTGSATSDEDRTKLQARLFALQKVTQSVRMAVSQENLNMLKQAVAKKKEYKADKSLLLIDVGCYAIDTVLEALNQFAETDDRFFLGFASDIKQKAASIANIL
jgi:hypothetical protein